MATLRSDVIIPEIFTPYVIEQSTQKNAFLASGVAQPMAELNATEGGDFVNVPSGKPTCLAIWKFSLIPPASPLARSLLISKLA